VRARPFPAGRGAAAEGVSGATDIAAVGTVAGRGPQMAPPADIGLTPHAVQTQYLDCPTDMEGRAVPDSWNAEIYRQRAAAWRQKAVLLPEGHEEATLCLEIAGGYARLARALEAKSSTPAKAIFPIPQAALAGDDAFAPALRRPQGPRISRRPPPPSRRG
jgi:hypothetical protein